MKTQTRLVVVGLVVLAGGGVAYAQAGKSKPPVAQAWLDVATYSGFGMGGMGGTMNPTLIAICRRIMLTLLSRSPPCAARAARTRPIRRTQP